MDNNEERIKVVNVFMVNEFNKLKGTKYTDVEQITDEEDVQTLITIMSDLFCNEIKTNFYSAKNSINVLTKTIEYLRKT